MSNDGDCDDTNGDINPDAEEIPDNEIDENCDSIKTASWYQDADEDGFGNSEVSQVADAQPTGYVSNEDDCDDTNGDINPDAEEIPDNEVDENCDDIIGLTWYEDADGDDFGNPDISLIADVKPNAHVSNADDCDDNNPNINPNAEEIPDNEIDENCDDLIIGTWYEDADEDGYGNASATPVVGSQPEGYVLDNTDCDDQNGDINPGATEVSGDGVDNNCDGDFEAVCGDGVAEGPEDCDDGNLDDTDGCSSTCELDSDGDGIPNSGEFPGCENDPTC